MDDYDMPFEGMSEEDLLYREMNPEDPWYMGPEEEDSSLYDCDEIDIDQLDDVD